MKTQKRLCPPMTKTQIKKLAKEHSLSFQEAKRAHDVACRVLEKKLREFQAMLWIGLNGLKEAKK